MQAFHDNFFFIVGELGASFIALISKKDGAISIKNLCPMSLIGSQYNILAKVLANCLRKVLPEVISDKKMLLLMDAIVLMVWLMVIARERVDSWN